MLFVAPEKEDILTQVPLSGATGRIIRPFLRVHNLTDDNIIVSHVIRCRPHEYPTAFLRRSAEKNCRQYDDSRMVNHALQLTDGLATWNPNVFIVCYEPLKAMKTTAYKTYIEAALTKALSFFQQGYRPCILFGAEATQLLAPWTNSSVGTFALHWWESDRGWPFHKEIKLV